MKIIAAFKTEFHIEVTSESSLGTVIAAISRGLMAGDGEDEYGRWSFIEKDLSFASAEVLCE